LALDIPCVLFFASSRFPPPSFAEVLIACSKIADTRPVIVDRGSVFLPREAPPDSSIPPDKAVPPGLEGHEEPASEGGVFGVVNNAQAAIGSKAGAIVLGGAASMLHEPRGFARLMAELRPAVGSGRILYAPGLAMPSNLALLTYCGIDVVDSVAVLFEASRGKWLNQDGSWTRDDLRRPPCRCPGCASGDLRRSLVEHNEIALWEEMELVRASIAAGGLREHVERRAANNPWNSAVLRHLDLRHYEFQEPYFPVTGSRVMAYAHQSLTRPDILRFRRRIKERHSKPPSAAVLLLLPCSARKPYVLSKSHRLFREAIVAGVNQWTVHEVIVTSPLGIVPRELEITYPAAHYDIPVTGDWSLDEAAIVKEDLTSYLERNKYDRIVAHLDVERPFVEGILDGAMFTCRGRATDDASLEALTAALREATEGLPKVQKAKRFAEDMTALARFQFGDGGEDLVKDAEFRGRYPEVRIIRDGAQLAMLTERGLLSLTLDGGRVLSQRDAYCVEIDDFYPQGSVFAVGVDGADARIRIGDDVVVRRGKEVRAVGVAEMASGEMIESERGVAVRVRHAVRSKSI